MSNLKWIQRGHEKGIIASIGSKQLNSVWHKKTSLENYNNNWCSRHNIIFHRLTEEKKQKLGIYNKNKKILITFLELYISF